MEEKFKLLPTAGEDEHSRPIELTINKSGSIMIKDEDEIIYFYPSETKQLMKLLNERLNK